MPPGEDIKRAITGAFLLLRGEPTAMRLFDLSVEGFWRSFTAALLVAPAYALLVAERHVRVGLATDPGAVVLVETIAYLAGCAAFPIAAIFLTRLLGLSSRYVPLIVVANWSAVPQACLLLLALLASTALPALRPSLFATATIIALAYQWFAIRTALQTTGSIALALIIVDVLLSFAVNLTADSVFAPDTG